MTYSSEELDGKIADAQVRFNEAKSKKETAEEAVREHDQEMYRLQGEYRVLTQMRELEAQAGAAPVDPLVIEAKPKKKGEE